MRIKNDIFLTMVIKKFVDGFEAFQSYVASIDAKGPPIYLYFTGSHSPETGKSWCPDCAAADPVIEKFIKNLDNNHIFVTVSVGERPYWKDPKCPFRTNPNSRLMVIPTLLKWKCPQRLEADQCAKPELLELFFSNDD